MPITRNEPVSSDFLSVSQPKLRTNTNSFDDVIGEDHYAASVTTGNAGKHRIMQHVVEASIPSTSTDIKTFSYEPLPALGPLLYNRKESDAISTPLSCLQSGSAAIVIAGSGTSNILDFGVAPGDVLPYCYGVVYVTGTYAASTSTVYNFFWDGSSGVTYLMTSATAITRPIVEFSTSILRVRNPSANSLTNVAWTVEFKRIHTPT